MLAQMPTPNGDLPPWVWVVIAIMGSLGFWGWAKVYTNKRFGLINSLLVQMSALQQQVGALTKTVDDLQTNEEKHLRRIEGVEKAYRFLARISINEINRLRIELKRPPITEWPPRTMRPATPNSPPPPVPTL